MDEFWSDLGLHLIEPLGGGPITQVWHVLDLNTQKHATLKWPQPSEDSFSLARRLLAREGEASRGLHHRSLPRLLRDESSATTPFLLLKFLNGKSLAFKRLQGAIWTLPCVIDLIRNAAEGLEILHAAGWVHGDVQPANILIETSGNTRLIDLGGAHKEVCIPLPKADDGFPLIGSADYWAPEVCLTNGLGNAPSDVFALGIVLYELLAERRPWPSGSLRETIKRHHGDPVAPLSSPWCRIPRKLIQLTEAMISRSQHDRPTATQVVDKLCEISTQFMAKGQAA